MVIGAVVSVQLRVGGRDDALRPGGAGGRGALPAARSRDPPARDLAPAPLEAGRDGFAARGRVRCRPSPGMNLCFYEALDRIPLGIAVTFEFVGPLLVGLFGSRRRLDLVWVACAAAGVLLADPARRDRRARPGSGSRCWRAGSGAPTSCSALESGGSFPEAGDWRWRWGSPQPDGGAGHRRGGGDLLDPGAAAVGAATGVLSSVIPYSLELEALRRIAVGTFGVLMSMEPAVAALIGLIALGQGLATVEVIGIALVVVASAGVLGASVERRRPRRERLERLRGAAQATSRRPKRRRERLETAGISIVGGVLASRRSATTACGARFGPRGRPGTSTQERICLCSNRPSSQFLKPKRDHGNPIGGRKVRK